MESTDAYLNFSKWDACFNILTGPGTTFLSNDQILGLVHPKMKITPWFTHSQSILGVFDFLHSDENNLSYIKKSWLFQVV